MIVEFSRTIKKGNDYVEDRKEKSPTEVLQMQPMPVGYYGVTIDKFEDGPRSITDIDPVVFVAICRFDNKPELVTCYAIQKQDQWGLKWFPEVQVNVYAHGAYVEACKMADQQPLSFVEWVKSISRGEIPFSLSVEEAVESDTPATTPPPPQASRPTGKTPISL